jgi:putative transposase
MSQWCLFQSSRLCNVWYISKRERRNRWFLCGQGGESAKEWGRCLEDIKNRGVEDILHICCDGLSRLKEVLSEAFPLSSIQRCVVHKMRNCMRLIDDKDSRAVIHQLKEVYNSTK